MSDFRKVIILRVFVTVFVMAFLAVGGICFLNFYKSSIIKNYSSTSVQKYSDIELCNKMVALAEEYADNLEKYLLIPQSEKIESKRNLKNIEREIIESGVVLRLSFDKSTEKWNYNEVVTAFKNFLYYGNEIIYNLDAAKINQSEVQESYDEFQYFSKDVKESTVLLMQSINNECYEIQKKLNVYLTNFDSISFGFLLVIVLITCICIAFCVKNINDITERDIMTGLLNQDGLVQTGGKISLLGNLTDYAAIYLNVKSFKYINRQVGSVQGDKILINYAGKLKKYLVNRGEVARLGGDTFEVLVLKSELDDFLYFLNSIYEDAYIGGELQKLMIQSRCGIYEIRKGDTMGDAINCSTIAYNEAKKENRQNYVWFDSTMMDKVVNEKETIVSFPKALKAKEFIVYYQPKVDLTTNQLNGCEALVRWKKNGKCINPNDFIPVLEKEGQVTELDFYVFEQVCKDLRHWLDSGIEPVKVSTNFSKKHLHNSHLAEDILRTMIKYKIDCKYIEVELTESSAYEDFDVLDTFVKQMRMAGISVSIDDFGTGYSSLTLLKDLDVNVIKLDKSFINRIDEDNKLDEIMIGNTVQMIHDLNRSVICEGVETRKQADFLRSVDCLNVQGYLYDKPLLSSEFEKRLVSPKYAV